MKQVSYKQGDRHGCNAFDAQRPWRVASVSLLRAETTAPPATDGAGGRGRHQLLGVRGHVIAAAKEAPLASGNGRGLHFPRERAHGGGEAQHHARYSNAGNTDLTKNKKVVRASTFGFWQAAETERKG
jgi:hypothetical protein